jgi:hypothetical protein
MDKRPWWPKVRTYPILILDDHATEWASRIAEDETRIEVDGGQLELMSEAATVRETERSDPSDTQRSQGYVPEHVWSGNSSSGLC